MLDGSWVYVAAVPIGLAIVALGTARNRTVVALVALAHLAILANSPSSRSRSIRASLPMAGLLRHRSPAVD